MLHSTIKCKGKQCFCSTVTHLIMEKYGSFSWSEDGFVQVILTHLFLHVFTQNQVSGVNRSRMWFSVNGIEASTEHTADKVVYF